ncbi:putative oligomerization/nucleic acid binding protein [Chryseobacterium sp. CBTAP 102]|uniref:PH domain-containing protein n=1 Tax=Chryseobacterium sp. CBTAP 102 TaxID=2135644 RepID=UPI000D94D825|nr:PH domain-containing protein [Chryseobacterium sp. CBTAP 102]PXW18211.1 putative oligomerization/nucleic acid binding protein [Chryseobacterium sp. CBTAP 102]
MTNNCALCTTELTSMDTLLGANMLSDGNVLCNKCLNKVTDINEELLYNLNKFSIHDISKMLSKEKTEEVQAVMTADQNLPAMADYDSHQIPKEVYKRRHQKIKKELEMLHANLSVFTKGEIKELPYLISEDEQIIAITDAQFVNTLAAGILVATPLRLISVSKAMFGDAKINNYPNETIKAVSFVTDPRSPIIKLHLDERVVAFECFMDKDDAENFYDKIKGIYNHPKEQSPKQIDNVVNKGISSEEILNQLEKLGKLSENGILTDAEFAEQKKKLLEQLK